MKKDIVYGVIWLVIGTIFIFCMALYMKDASNSFVWIVLFIPLFMFHQGVGYLMGMKKKSKDK